MFTPNPEWFFKQLGYRPARTIVRETLTYAGLLTAGVIVGGVAVALFTPKSGRELRSDISSRAGELKERISERGRQLKDNVDEMRARARAELDEKHV